MSTSTSFSQYESQSSPERYPLLNSEPSHPIPVFSYLSVPSQLAPSMLSVSPTRATPHLPSSASSSHSDWGSEDSAAAFEAQGSSPPSTTPSSHGTQNNGYGFEFGHAYEVAGSTCSSPKTTSLAPSHERTPVSLPINASEWTEIFAEISDNAAGASERFARIVKGDLMRVSHRLKDIESLTQQRNRRVNDENKPLDRIPSSSGHVMPLGCRAGVAAPDLPARVPSSA